MEEYKKFYIIERAIKNEFINSLNNHGCDALLGLFVLDHIKAELSEQVIQGSFLTDLTNAISQKIDEVEQRENQEKEPIDLGVLVGVESNASSDVD